jgi:hypothetical protein
MKSLLANCTGKLVQVASPAIFGDARLRICELVGLENMGVWLVSQDLTKLVYGDEANGAVPVLIPLSQVIYLTAGATPPARSVETNSSTTRCCATIGGRSAKTRIDPTATANEARRASHRSCRGGGGAVRLLRHDGHHLPRGAGPVAAASLSRRAF